MPGYAAVFLSMVMTAIGFPLLCVFISEFLSLRGAFEANPLWAALGRAGDHSECRLYALALSTNVFWHHRQSKE